MGESHKPVIILMADDDEDDRLMAAEALQEARVLNEFRTVTDGQDLLDYLNQKGRHAEPGVAPRPDIILLDLNMPRKDGREALKELRADPALRHIPVVVLTTSKAEEDILRTYDLGVNSFIVKPVTFDQLVEVMRALSAYWFQIVRLPEKIW